MSNPNTSEDLAWLEDLSGGLPDFAHYEKLANLSTDQYLSLQHGLLGDKVLRLHRIYLDQKYWNYCRDALRGRPQRPAHAEILSLLRRLVQTGVCVCPASHVVLDETLRQSDIDSRTLTAQLIDELSTGICLQPYFFFVGFEIYHWLKTKRPDPPDVHPVARYAWTYPTNVLGVSVPHVTAMPPDMNAAMQKFWFDFSSRIPFSRMAAGMHDCPHAGRKTPIEHYLKQNEMCETHRGDFQTFGEAFLLELRGALEAEETAVREAWTLHYERETGNRITDPECEDARQTTMAMCGLIYSAFQHHKITTQMPSLRIPVGIHAALRHGRRKHRMGDIEDHMHASLALPYCNAFFTEKTLGNLLTREPLGYDRLYGCTVLWKDNDIIQHLEQTKEDSIETVHYDSPRADDN